MSLDDVLKSFAAFNQGMTQYKISQATNQATEQLQALQGEEDVKARLLQQTQIANELALKMTGAGADASQVQAATSGLGLTAGQLSQQSVVPASESYKRQQVPGYGNLSSDVKYETDAKLAQARATQGTKMDEKQIAFVQKYQQMFNKQADKSIQGTRFAETLKAIIDSRNPIGDQAAKRFAARASTEVGVLTDQDVKSFGGSKAIADRISQAASEAATGRMSEKNRKFMREFAATVKAAHEKAVLEARDKISTSAENTAKLGGYGLRKDQIAEMLYSTENSSTPSQAPAPEQKQGLGLKNFIRKPGQ